MPRVKRAAIRHTRIKRIRRQAKGFRGARGNLLRTMQNAITKAQQYAYRDRRTRKRSFRRLWISRIAAAAKMNGTSYSVLMGQLKKSDVALNRKVLSEIAIVDMPAFKEIVEFAGK